MKKYTIDILLPSIDTPRNNNLLPPRYCYYAFYFGGVIVQKADIFNNEMPENAQIRLYELSQRESPEILGEKCIMCNVQYRDQITICLTHFAR